MAGDLELEGSANSTWGMVLGTDEERADDRCLKHPNDGWRRLATAGGQGRPIVTAMQLCFFTPGI
jgi:hypothetical protein